jgi:hypothetical protein
MGALPTGGALAQGGFDGFEVEAQLAADTQTRDATCQRLSAQPLARQLERERELAGMQEKRLVVHRGTSFLGAPIEPKRLWAKRGYLRGFCVA